MEAFFVILLAAALLSVGVWAVVVGRRLLDLNAADVEAGDE